MGSFAEDVVVEPITAGRYRADLSHDWDLVAVPQGGVIASLALRAAGLEVDDPEQALRTSTTVFAGQTAAAALEIDVQILRRGRSATQVVSTIRNEGGAGRRHGAGRVRIVATGPIVRGRGAARGAGAGQLPVLPRFGPGRK
jgi:Thioesterase-like superfamily